MLSSWFGNYAAVKANGTVQSAIEALVRFDPAGASEADLRSMEGRLDQLGGKVASAQTSYDKERREADEIESQYEGRVKAVAVLKGKADAEGDPARKETLTRSLTTFVADTKSIREKVLQERDDADKAKALLDSLQAAYRSAAEKLRGARQMIERANRDRQEADQRLAAAQEREQTAREAAGLTQASNGVDVALKAMHEAAERTRAQAAVLDEKSRLLTPSDVLRDDPGIAAAMREAKGGAPAPSLDDEIASLKL